MCVCGVWVCVRAQVCVGVCVRVHPAKRSNRSDESL